ncbi:hypothetical protein CPJCM30710_19570 [Clostridium polyendosporum]|uniref:Uncharacterized protein n=1 Tax=Clostridium polyendosporum TaxID=69208 RepID=A0A919S0Z8_9CLOT|nr:hypothetical protein CPJCM30710_19570 [Clostridium polyendosporum]
MLSLNKAKIPNPINVVTQTKNNIKNLCFMLKFLKIFMKSSLKVDMRKFYIHFDNYVTAVCFEKSPHLSL